MEPVLTDAQRERYAEFQAFAASRVAPFARDWDREQRIAPAALAELGRAGYLGATLPAEFGGRGWDAVTFGLLNEALGRHDSAYTGYITVQAMVAMALLKWGAPEQKRRWLPPLARGEIQASIALTEPGAGSDLQGLATELVRAPAGEGYRLRGEKKWISAAQISAVFLVFARCEGRPVACLVPRDAPGLEVEPILDLMGFRAAGLGRVRFRDVPVGSADLVGKPGFALSHIAPIALHYGRLSTACSALGLLRACCEESAAYAAARRIGATAAADLGMVQSLIARMATDLEAANWLCWSACAAEDRRSPRAYAQAFTAKYFTSQAAVRAAADAVQIHGAAGVHESSPVARCHRSAKIMEIIEGTTQVHEAVIAQDYVRSARAALPGKRA